MRHVELVRISWPVRGTFTISRGSITQVDVLTATLAEGDARGRAECRPYARYNESQDSVSAEIEALRPQLEAGLDRAALQTALHAGAARNLLDCALWDLEAKLSGKPVWQLAGLPEPKPVISAYTLSIDTPHAMGRAAEAQSKRPLLKLKLKGDAEDLARVAAVRQGAPSAQLIIDANEAWSLDQCRDWFAEMARLDVALIEQPLPAADDEGLKDLARPVLICADESCHDSTSLARLLPLYDAINIKLDKAGGLTEAIHLQQRARQAGLKTMVGCMLASSLAMAPAMLLVIEADFVDLDGPLWLAQDTEPAIEFIGSVMQPAPRPLWG